jgi:hypothetical protein
LGGVSNNQNGDLLIMTNFKKTGTGDSKLKKRK